MTWKFHVLTTTQRRMFSRILQVLESQMVEVHSFAGESSGEETSISFLCSSPLDKAYRIKALMYRLEGVHSVKAFADG
jgi:hypothetical protein